MVTITVPGIFSDRNRQSTKRCLPQRSAFCRAHTLIVLWRWKLGHSQKNFAFPCCTWRCRWIPALTVCEHLCSCCVNSISIKPLGLLQCWSRRFTHLILKCWNFSYQFFSGRKARRVRDRSGPNIWLLPVGDIYHVPDMGRLGNCIQYLFHVIWLWLIGVWL